MPEVSSSEQRLPHSAPGSTLGGGGVAGEAAGQGGH